MSKQKKYTAKQLKELNPYDASACKPKYKFKKHKDFVYRHKTNMPVWIPHEGIPDKKEKADMAIELIKTKGLGSKSKYTDSPIYVTGQHVADPIKIDHDVVKGHGWDSGTGGYFRVLATSRAEVRFLRLADFGKMDMSFLNVTALGKVKRLHISKPKRIPPYLQMWLDTKGIFKGDYVTTTIPVIYEYLNADVPWTQTPKTGDYVLVQGKLHQLYVSFPKDPSVQHSAYVIQAKELYKVSAKPTKVSDKDVMKKWFDYNNAELTALAIEMLREIHSDHKDDEDG